MTMPASVQQCDLHPAPPAAAATVPAAASKPAGATRPDEPCTAGGRETDPRARTQLYRRRMPALSDEPIGAYSIVGNAIYGANASMANPRPRQDQPVLHVYTAAAT